jgi:hypothetical protein
MSSHIFFFTIRFKINIEKSSVIISVLIHQCKIHAVWQVHRHCYIFGLIRGEIDSWIWVGIKYGIYNKYLPVNWAMPSKNSNILYTWHTLLGCSLLQDYERQQVIRNRFRGIHACAGIFKQSMGTRNRVGIGLLYRSARLHRLAELIPWNWFLGSFKV